MNPNIPAIEQLQELALPAPISYAPHTWGWAVLLGLLLASAALLGARRYWHWRRNRYRRQALARLGQLRQARDPLAALRELPELLKRAALSMPSPAPPHLAAPLSGEPWQAFLRRHGPAPAGFSQQLALLAYAPDATLLALPAPQRQALFDHCQHWLEHHHVAA